MVEYNNQGDEICNHEFDDGLCIKCLCPETPEDQIRAENALYNVEALEAHYMQTSGHVPPRAQVIAEAWKLHRKQPRD